MRHGLVAAAGAFFFAIALLLNQGMHHRYSRRASSASPGSDDAVAPQPRDRSRVVAEFGQDRLGVLAEIGGGAELFRLRVAAHVNGLADRFQGAELRMVDRPGDAEMPHLRV